MPQNVCYKKNKSKNEYWVKRNGSLLRHSQTFIGYGRIWLKKFAYNGKAEVKNGMLILTGIRNKIVLRVAAVVNKQ